MALHVEDLDACMDFYRDFCDMKIVHARGVGDHRIVWMAESGRETGFIFVMMTGGQNIELRSNDYRHFGFAVSSRADVDEIARRAGERGCLVLSPFTEGLAEAKLYLISSRIGDSAVVFCGIRVLPGWP